jgi:hypothetical protein
MVQKQLVFGKKGMVYHWVDQITIYIYTYAHVYNIHINTYNYMYNYLLPLSLSPHGLQIVNPNGLGGPPSKRLFSRIGDLPQPAGIVALSM